MQNKHGHSHCEGGTSGVSSVALFAAGLVFCLAHRGNRLNPIEASNVCVIFKNSSFCLIVNATRSSLDYADHEDGGNTLLRNVRNYKSTPRHLPCYFSLRTASALQTPTQLMPSTEIIVVLRKIRNG